MILSAVFSHFHVGPVHFSTTNSGFISRSPLLTFLNILITFLGMCLTIHLTTARFGPGDGAHLRYILPILILVPIFLISAIVAGCFLLPCKSHSKQSVYNPNDPGQWCVVDSGDQIVPEEEVVGMEAVPYAKISV